MTINYSNLLEFIGEDLKSYVILRNVMGYDNYIELKRTLLNKGVDFYDKDNAHLSSKKNVIFKRRTNNKSNCIVVHCQDLPISPDTDGVFLITSAMVESDKKRRYKKCRKSDSDVCAKKDSKIMTKLKQMPYDEYLKTSHWQKVRQRKIKDVGYKCQICGESGKELHLHHNSYEHKGEEQHYLEDLVVLCCDCHNLFHKYKKIK